MTTEALIKYLRSQGTGIDQAQLEDTAQIAFETAYGEVWGSYRWTVRRSQVTLTLTVSGTTTDLPKDFERAIWMSLQKTGRKHEIVIKPEEWFDLHHPYPDDDSDGVPFVCKIVHSPATPTDKWKAYWWRVPNEAYSVVLSYDRSANTGEFPNLPSHMVKPVVAGALSLMKANVNDRQGFDNLFERALARAQRADKTVSGILPLFGSDQGWDDFDTGSVRVGGTNDPLSFY